jgi:hypothetical protein
MKQAKGKILIEKIQVFHYWFSTTPNSCKKECMGVVQDSSMDYNTPTIIVQRGQQNCMKRKVAMWRTLYLKYKNNRKGEQQCEEESQVTQRKKPSNMKGEPNNVKKK